MPENEGLRRAAQRLFQRHPMFWEPAALTPSGEYRLPIVFRIHISSMTGRRTRDEADQGNSQEKPLPEVTPPGWFAAMRRRLRGSSAD